MVEVFKTNIEHSEQSDFVRKRLMELFPDLYITFDLEDCDKILRVQGKMIQVHVIIGEMRSNGFVCEVLE